MDLQPCDGVFEGGGIKGLALAGAVAVFEERGYRFANLAGTSAGAIVAALLAAGYTGAELCEIMEEIDFAVFLDGTSRLLPRTSATWNLLVHWGFYRGDKFLAWMTEMLSAKGVRTFGDLARRGDAHATRHPLRVVASDVTRGRMIVMPQDATAYNIDPDDFSVPMAVRMSMSIPYFFRPVTMRRLGRPPCYIVDGGLLSNFPISLFDGPEFGDRPTFGFRLSARHDRQVAVRHEANWLFSYLAAMFLTATEAADNRYVDTRDFLRTINIDNCGFAATQFSPDASQKLRLRDSGRRAAEAFLATWDFEDYANKRRRWFGLPRRDIVADCKSGEISEG